MGERYIVSGAQLGMFQAFAKGEQSEETEKLVQEIIDNQFVGNTTTLIKEDVKKIQELLMK